MPWQLARDAENGGYVYCGFCTACSCKLTGASELTTVLLVDDDPNILAPLQLLVEREGYRVVTASDGKAALAATAVESPGLIVTDWMMPNVDGVELCRRLKDDPAMADIPVVMLSSAVPPTPEEPLWDVLLRKPAPLGHLIMAIHRLLDRPRPEPPGHPSGQ
ncbi:response regulator transcription factor [Burkholderia ubonensis]|uniref:response regulator transcription factor n=1 Tax=Burkholderia ubonensis TaxID=101571 RepID=UPI00358E2CF7